MVKAYGWEPALAIKIHDIRARETKSLRRLLFLRALNQVLTFIVPTFAMTVVFLIYSIENAVDETVVFTSLAILSVIRPPLLSLPKAVDIFAEFFVSIKRIQDFILLEEQQEEGRLLKNDVQATTKSGTVCFKDASFTWGASTSIEVSKKNDQNQNQKQNENQEEKLFRLSHISLDIQQSSFVCIVGSVGSGKTTLLLSILGEMNRIAGEATVKGRIAFAGQSPWIQNASIRDGILFSQGSSLSTTDMVQLDLAYTKAIDASQLGPDLASLVDGDKTVIGDRGVNLSGGQKQRIALARCLQRASSCDLFVMDDVLSAVDVDVADAIVRDALLGVLQKVTRIVVLNSHYHVLKHSDWVVVVDKGQIAGQGTYEEIVANAEFANFLQLDDDEENLFLPEEKDKEEKNKEEKNKDKDQAKNEEKMQEKVSKKKEKKDVSVDVGIVAIEEIEVQAEQAEAEPDVQEAAPIPPQATRTNATTTTTTTTILYAKEKRRVGALDVQLYATYFAAGCCDHGYLALLLILCLTVLTQTLSVFSDVWLAEWARETTRMNATTAANVSAPATYLDTAYWQWSYVAWLPGITLSAILRSFLFSWIAIRSSTRIHDTSMERVLRAPLSTYFDITPVGRLINRFSKDQDSIDSALPSFLAEFSESMVFLTSILVLCAIYAPVFLVAMVPLSYLFYRFRAFFSASSRELKRMQAVSRSPMYSMFSETIEGLDHVRAFDKTKSFQTAFQLLADKNGKMFFYSFMLIPYSILRMDLVGSFLILSVAIALVTLRDTVDAASAGLAIAYSLQVMGRLQMTVTCSIETENHMVAVERLRELATMPQEKSRIITTTAEASVEFDDNKEWPKNGKIEFHNVHIRYRENLPLVCKGINVTVPAGKRVGVCGRTGSGKSTLLSALLRLVELEKGTISIDGVDIAGVPLNRLRQSIAVIPQDALMFSGTLRDNLDPSGVLSDDKLLDVLKKTFMMDVAVSLAKQTLDNKSGGGDDRDKVDVLSARVTEGGANFSVGERQLLSIARGMLREAKVIILDEATSNVDGESDAKIQKVLRDVFVGSTSMTIAHRIETIADSDFILVLDQGMVVEFDSPNALLERDSIFRQLVEQSESK